ncbi:family 20 glycosylhydrolase [Actinokineospora xionganensis]|uniref:Family 20 glycosylhydrolase n=1 Tax=Actinokineospora xionganensis TaxID=2684470 RepID=A0ABR7L0Y5_9PSEU|nr:family 20 glycosylhydrolase [Actinokineospora xionganensis]MBC6446032.1 family 20 glycosylhydrolase [Actinokineospora xionganensis]
MVQTINRGLALSLAALALLSTAPAAAQDDPAVNAAPQVVPAVRQWSGGVGRLRLGPDTKIVLDPADGGALRDVAEQVGADLTEMTGWPVPAVREGRAGERDLVLDLDAGADVGPTELALKEGYRLTTDSRVTITSRTPVGAYWGTRTLLQMLSFDGQASASVPVGSLVDWPNVAVRGFMLDVGRRWFDHDFMRDYVRHMSWFKLNTFQVHLNDNEITAPGGDWSKAYSAFRLASDNPRFAGLAATDGAFTRADWDRLEEVAADRFVTVVPEIDAPAHARAFIEFDPSLGLNGGNSDHLDLRNPAATQFMKDVYDEFAPWFRAPAIHVGADEYPRAYATQYRDYVNEIAAHVRGLGKEVRAWGSLSVMSGGANGYDRDITMHSWNNGWYGPKAALADGYPLINTNDGLLYIVPFANYYHGKGLDGRWLHANWEPHVFAGGQTVDPEHPLLRGAMSAVWNDLVHAKYTATDVHGLVEPTFGLLAQKMWRGKVPGQTYEQFMATVGDLGVGPGMENLQTTLPGGDRGLRTRVDPPPVLAGGETARMAATVTNTGHYAVDTVDAALALSLPGVRVVPASVGPDILEPGATGTWAWQVTADPGVATGTARAEVTFTANRRGREVGSRAFGVARTVEAAPAGTEHLSFTATATASSVEGNLDRLAASHVNDGDLGTRWASRYTDAEWIQLRLARPSTIRSVKLFWEAACAARYRVQTSMDGVTWHDAATVDQARCGVESIALDAPEPALYVRLQGVGRATGYGYSLHEFWAFGTAIS